MKKYRIKLKDRIIGPFSQEQIKKLLLNSKIQGTETVQSFPYGEWTSFKEQDELIRFLFEIESSSEDSSEDKTKILSNLKNIEGFSEFKFKKDKELEIDYSNIDEKLEDISSEDQEIEPTRLINKNDREEIIDKTIVKSRPPLPLQKENPPSPLKKEEKINRDQMTQMISTREIFSKLKKEIHKFEKEEKKELKKEFKRKEETEDIIEEPKSKPSTNKKRRKGLKPLIALFIFVFLFILIFPGEESAKEIYLKYPQIKAPITEEIINETRAEEYFKLGLRHYSLNNYSDLVLASNYFKKSLEFKYENNRAFGWLIISYSELYPYAKSKKEASKVIFNLIQIAQSKRYKDVNVAIGISIFYQAIEKYPTAINLIENFLRLNKPNARLITEYLGSLTKISDVVRGEKVSNHLKSFKNKTAKSYEKLSKFFILNGDYKNSFYALKQGLKEYSKSTLLLLEYARQLLENDKYDILEKILKKIKKNGFESNPHYYASYLEYAGILKGIRGDVKGSTILFQKSLKIKDSKRLDQILSNVNDPDSSKLQKELVKTSKIKNFIREAKIAYSEGNVNQAITFAINASDLNPLNIESNLSLVGYQLEKGYYEIAIKRLQNLLQKDALNSKVIYVLIKAFIESYQLSKAHEEIGKISNTKLSLEAEYASLLGEYYKRKGNPNLAVRWLQLAINRNPLDDNVYYSLAQIYFYYKKLKSCKRVLSKAITLDPINIQYHNLYSKILYEEDGLETAVGYLRNILEENKDNPKILSSIAIYYYREGKIKDYNFFREKLEKLDSQDPALINFLFNIGILNDNKKDIIKYGKILIEQKPKDLEVQIKLAEIFFEKGHYKEAISTLDNIKNRLRNYPKSNYYLSEIYLAKKDFKKAIHYAHEETKYNPKIYYGYYILGKIYFLKKEYLKVIKNLEKALSLNPQAIGPLLILGDVKYRQNFFDQAREYYLRARIQEKNNPKIRRRLGFVYRKIGQNNLAVEEFKIYLKLNPGATDRGKIQSIIEQLQK